ncbi:serine kinase, partial [Erwinia amylovora]|nr:serine kinase [Erwinia amylovora]
MINDALLRLAELTMARYPAFVQGRLCLLCRSENATFLLQSRRTSYALRLLRADYHQRADIESELHWL